MALRLPLQSAARRAASSGRSQSARSSGSRSRQCAASGKYKGRNSDHWCTGCRSLWSSYHEEKRAEFPSFLRSRSPALRLCGHLQYLLPECGPADTLRHREYSGATGLKRADMFGIDPLVFWNYDIPISIPNIKARQLATPAVCNKFDLSAFAHQCAGIGDKKMRQNLLGRKSNRFEQNSGRHFPTAVNAEVKNIFGVELEIKP